MDFIYYFCRQEIDNSIHDLTNSKYMRNFTSTFISIFLVSLLALAVYQTGNCQTMNNFSGLSACRQYAMEIPLKPDYADSSLWYIDMKATGNNGVDVFYIVSTWSADWTDSAGTTRHFEDAYHPAYRDLLIKEISFMDSISGESNNYYAPMYRQLTFETWLHGETAVDSAFPYAFEDIKSSFRHYLTNYNNGRPFIIAGFSQGGKAVVELLKVIPKEVQPLLVAAYVMGYKVTKADTTCHPAIIPACGETDTGVTICYNSVSDRKYIKDITASNCAFCINPVNWSIKDTPAILDDSITVATDTVYHVLTVKGYGGGGYTVYPGYFNDGDYHSSEITLYAKQLKKNIAKRSIAWRLKRNINSL